MTATGDVAGAAMAAVGALAVGVALASTLRDGPRADRSGGGARWATGRDLRELTVARRRPGRPAPRPPAGRLALGWHGSRLVAAEVAHSLVVLGPTQSGKTTGCAVPAILDWRGPVVATSVKSDLLAATVGHRRGVGPVDVFDPSGVSGMPATPWSPLPTARTWPGARRAAAALTDSVRTQAGPMTDGDFWYATAARLLAPLLLAAATAGLTVADVLRWVETQDAGEALGILAPTGLSAPVDALVSFLAKDDRHRSSVATTAETVLDPFVTADADGTRDPFDPGRLLGSGGTLYVTAPAHDQHRLAPLFGGILSDLLHTAYDRVARTGRPLDPPLLVVLDEAASLAPLPDLDGLAATAASHGIQLVTVWQDLAQVRARHGHRAATVVNNHRAKLILPGCADPETLEYVGRLVGDERVVVPTTTSGGPGRPTTSRAPVTRPLLPADALRRLPRGRAVLVYRDLPPVRLRLRSVVDDPVPAGRAGPGGDPGRGAS